MFGIEKEPMFTRYGMGVLGYSVTLDISRAKKELGYLPKVSVKDGVERFLKDWKGRDRA